VKNNLKVILECRLKEYDTHMNFQLENSQRRYILVGLNIAALGTFISLALTSQSILLVSITSLVSSALGIVWIGESFWAVRSDNYIIASVIPAIRALSNDPGLFSDWSAQHRTELASKMILLKRIIQGKQPGATAAIFLFFTPAVVSWLVVTIFGLVNLPQTWYFWVLNGIDVIFLCLLASGGYFWYREWTKGGDRLVNDHQTL